MGKVVVENVVLRNFKDENLYEEGFISKVRETTVSMIADTGARAVGLPFSIIASLGLSAVRKIKVQLANGMMEDRTLYGNLSLQIEDRQGVFECLGKPEEAPLLLGQLVLETLDFVVDCPNQRLIPNPKAPEGMMLYEDF